MTAERSAATCVVADDHPAIRAGIKELLEAEGMTVLALAREGSEALAAIEQHRPQVAILDLRMPGLTGVEVARRVRQSSPETRIVVYTGHADPGQLADAMDAGARGYILKEAPLDDLLRAIDTVLAGGTYVDPVLLGSMTSATIGDPGTKLTQREREVLRLIADGLTNEQAAKRLFLSPETVRTHLRKAMRKLDADTRTQAVATAIRRSLIS